MKSNVHLMSNSSLDWTVLLAISSWEKRRPKWHCHFSKGNTYRSLIVSNEQINWNSSQFTSHFIVRKFLVWCCWVTAGHRQFNWKVLSNWFCSNGFICSWKKISHTEIDPEQWLSDLKRVAFNEWMCLGNILELHRETNKQTVKLIKSNCRFN